MAYLPKGWRYRDFAGGWRFRLLHTTRAEGGPSSGTARYVLFKGDWYDAWRLYKATDGFAKAYEQEIPLWVRKVKYGTFWGPPLYEGPAKTVKRLCQKLGDAYLTIGVFGWSLDGDYETERPFITETMHLVMTPEYFARCVKALQTDPRAKVGLYVQGTLIDSYSDAFRNHPEWALTDREGRPLDSNMADNPVGRLFIFNPRNDGWVRHFLSRIKALLLKYDPGWLYNDGGAVFEGMDWRTGLPVKVTHWLDITRRMLEVVRSTGPERALLLNAENFPYGDMYWLECPYFSPTIPWRETVEYCFDTEFLHDPRRTMLPLYWRDEDRYLAMCISFGFTPCGPLTDVFSPKVWRAIEAAWAMRPGELVARSD
ncbi:MAG TPA: hypothetical protein EYP90_02730, partial [Chromatiaceae bacterium]|nr:hypothetical protein [Chromatiaceae bacterium]